MSKALSLSLIFRIEENFDSWPLCLEVNIVIPYSPQHDYRKIIPALIFQIEESFECLLKAAWNFFLKRSICFAESDFLFAHFKYLRLQAEVHYF